MNLQGKARIRELNDAFRRSFVGGSVMLTSGVHALPERDQATLLEKVRGFDAFDSANDPHQEHDFGSLEIEGQRYFWKLDLYEEPGVKDTNGEPVVTRVLTIMLADEY